MSTETRWTVVPRSTASCVLALVAGVLLLGSVIWQMADAGGVAVLPLVAAVAAFALIVVAVVGLVLPKTRGR
jgi:hypothetical protein